MYEKCQFPLKKKWTRITLHKNVCIPTMLFNFHEILELEIRIKPDFYYTEKLKNNELLPHLLRVCKWWMINITTELPTYLILTFFAWWDVYRWIRTSVVLLYYYNLSWKYYVWIIHRVEYQHHLVAFGQRFGEGAIT